MESETRVCRSTAKLESIAASPKQDMSQLLLLGVKVLLNGFPFALGPDGISASLLLALWHIWIGW